MLLKYIVLLKNIMDRQKDKHLGSWQDWYRVNHQEIQFGGKVNCKKSQWNREANNILQDVVGRRTMRKMTSSNIMDRCCEDCVLMKC